jgi:predicted PhzF superfamily epimerase YddE/YHI9
LQALTTDPVLGREAQLAWAEGLELQAGTAAVDTPAATVTAARAQALVALESAAQTHALSVEHQRLRQRLWLAVSLASDD